ncbi:malate dehydrogenase, mitochondrial-like [Atheta coriaria]|uniref:malate dehydrogenase, mitochondrial-like n=1 Tax=Dalotia coriaria TaxID=877792 RepID=UPI0031F39419
MSRIIRRPEIIMQSMKKMIHGTCSNVNPNAINLTILGNMVPAARMVAMLLKQCHGIDEIRLYGTEHNVCNTALDLAQVDTNTLIKAYKGDNRLLRDAIVDSKIILLCGGYPITTATKQADLFDENVAAVRNIVLHCVEHNPKAILLVATPPINSFIPMISEEYKREGVYDPKKIIGISTLSTIIANSLIGKYLKYDPIHVHCPVIGGDSLLTRVPILSQCTPSLDTFPEDDRIALYNTIVNSTKTCLDAKRQENLGPLYLSQAFAISRFVTNLVNALLGAEGVYECAFVRQTGHISSFLPYMQSIVKLGPEGVAGSYMPKVTQWECDRLLKAYVHLKTIFTWVPV